MGTCAVRNPQPRRPPGIPVDPRPTVRTGVTTTRPSQGKLSRIRWLYWSWDGRIQRSTWWAYTLLLGLVFGGLGRASTSGGTGELVFSVIVWLISVPFFLALDVKRWHDRDKPAWWAVVCIIPIVGWLLRLVVCGFLPGAPGPNRYGDGPRDRFHATR